MKIEFKQQTGLDGTWYYTEVDGRMITGSFKTDKDVAYTQFLRIVELNGNPAEITTLETKLL